MTLIPIGTSNIDWAWVAQIKAQFLAGQPGFSNLPSDSDLWRIHQMGFSDAEIISRWQAAVAAAGNPYAATQFAENGGFFFFHSFTAFGKPIAEYFRTDDPFIGEGPTRDPAEVFARAKSGTALAGNFTTGGDPEKDPQSAAELVEREKFYASCIGNPKYAFRDARLLYVVVMTAIIGPPKPWSFGAAASDQVDLSWLRGLSLEDYITQMSPQKFGGTRSV